MVDISIHETEETVNTVISETEQKENNLKNEPPVDNSKFPVKLKLHNGFSISLDCSEMNAGQFVEQTVDQLQVIFFY